MLTVPQFTGTTRRPPGCSAEFTAYARAVAVGERILHITGWAARPWSFDSDS
jgi:hypothetical protein